MEGWLHFASLHGCIDTSLIPVRMDILDFGHRNIMVWSSISTSSTSGRTDLNSVDLYSLHLLVIPSTDMQTINIVQEGHVYQIHIPLVRIGVRPVVPKSSALCTPPNRPASKYDRNCDTSLYKRDELERESE